MTADRAPLPGVDTISARPVRPVTAEPVQESDALVRAAAWHTTDHDVLPSGPGDATRHVLVFAEAAAHELRSALLADAPLESAAFVLARPIRTPAGAWRLLAYEVIAVSPDDYRIRTEVAIELPPAQVARVMERARAEHASVLVVHTHPRAGSVSPSAWDRDGEARLMPALARRIPGVPHGRVIVGLNTWHAALFEVDGVEWPLTIDAVGHELHRITDRAIGGARLAGSESSTGMDAGRFDRQVRAFGRVGQQRLADVRVTIVGVGGTGSVVAQQLAHLGVGAVRLVDPDVVDPSNLNRVVGARPDDIGALKVEVAAAMMREINPGMRIEALRGDVCDAAVARRVLDGDLFFCCTDSHGSRAVLSQLAYQYWLPGIDMGVAIQVSASGEVTHISGRVQLLSPGLACLVCGGVLDPETVRRDLLTTEARAADPYIQGASGAAPQPAVISINSATASLAVTMFLAVVTGMPIDARHQRLRLETGQVVRVEVPCQPGCPVCGRMGAQGRGDAWPAPGRGR